MSGLTLERRLGERVVLVLADGSRVHVVPVEIRQGRVKLSFIGPRTVRIHREEVLERIEREGERDRG